MNATKLFSRALVVVVSIFFMAAVAVGQNLILGGTAAATYGGTWNVKGNIDNTTKTGVVDFTGTVTLKGTATQAIGITTKPAINFATLTSSAPSTKTFAVNSTIGTTINTLRRHLLSIQL
ncbi:MAG: hypothetical protein NTX44_03720 [Ignavibacteriales bacterium]|nr:hypothetical protein [Ignavibacteriales bacterium]